MTARDDILAAIDRITARSGTDVFTLTDVIEEMGRAETPYAESTIRTHVTSRMCANAPDHHQTVYDDLIWVGRGQYRLNV